MIDVRLLRDVKLAESCCLEAYRDSRGFWTIGYGHLLDQAQNWEGYTITKAEAEELLVADLRTATRHCVTLEEWPKLNECRANALVELVFNMGLTHWVGFHDTRRALQAEDWARAYDELLDSKWAEQVKEHRAKRLAGYLLRGVYP